MRRGARSIRGALGAYVWASGALVLGLALVLWWRPRAEHVTRVELPDDPALIGATLQSDALDLPLELARGASLDVPPGDYRLRLFLSDGTVRESSLRVEGERLRLAGEVGASSETDDATRR